MNLPVTFVNDSDSWRLCCSQCDFWRLKQVLTSGTSASKNIPQNEQQSIINVVLTDKKFMYYVIYSGSVVYSTNLLYNLQFIEAFLSFGHLI